MLGLLDNALQGLVVTTGGRRAHFVIGERLSGDPKQAEAAAALLQKLIQEAGGTQAPR